LARSSGTSAIIMGRSDDGNSVRVKLPSGDRKALPSEWRAMIGVISGGGRADKPVMKAGNNFHKFRVKRKKYPYVRGVAVNPVDHKFGGGNHQHLGAPATVSRRATPGQKVGKVAARRTGLLRGSKKNKVAIMDQPKKK